MATSFDATARINLDIRSFAKGANAVTKSGGQMEKIFQNLNQVMGKVAHVEADLAAKLRTSLQVYSQISAAARNYATTVATLQKNETAGARGAKLMTQAFQQMRSALAEIQPIGQKEFTRIQRTLALYERMASAIQKLAAAQKQMSSITQNAINSQQKDEQLKQKAQQTAAKLALEEQKLALQRQKAQQSAARQALEEQKLALAREKAAQAAARIAQEDARLAMARQRAVTANQNLNKSNVSVSASTYAIRSAVGELEGAFQSLYRTVSAVPTAVAGAAISQEKAFAQVERVVGDAEAASAGLLTRFQQIAQQAPISFEEVARIGQLGAQIGVAASELGDFTNTIVMFSLTTGVASEEATLLLGRIAQMQNVPIYQMEQLGSAILALGTASAATDQEILRVNASIATASNLFGLTAQQTAGLSAALATLQVRPELSRGSLTRVFNELTTAVQGGGTELSKLAKVMNMTDAEVVKLFKNPAMRGEFLLAFISGLSRAAGAGGDVQGVLRGLGINAVRDIDVFSRLANNVDIVTEAFDRANVEFAKGAELERQAKGIYKTTAAELQNLSDAFKTLLATLGGPLAEALGYVASGLSDIIENVAHLGPIVPIFGAIASVVTLGGAAWLVYQIGMAKVVQSLVAAKELQRNLGVSTLGLGTAMKVVTGQLLNTATAQAQVANTGMVAANNSKNLAASLAASTAGLRAAAAASTSTAQGYGILSAATVAAGSSSRTMFTAAASQQGMLRQLRASGAATTVTIAGLANANRSAALTQTQLAGAQRMSAAQTAIAASAISSYNASAVRTVPVLSTMSNSMRNAANAGATLGSGMATVGHAGGVVATAFSRTTAEVTRTGIAARLAAAAFSPWTLAIATIGFMLAPAIGKMFSFRTEAERITSAALEATGGTKALANAIKTDTEAAVTAAGGMRQYVQAVRNGSAETLKGIGVYRTITTVKGDMAAADQRAAENLREEAQQRIRAIEETKGSVAALQEQAKGHGRGAQAARTYLAEIAEARREIEASTKALGENTVALGENYQQWLLDTAQAALEQSKLADGSKTSTIALKRMSEAGVNVGQVLRQSLEDPKTALDTLNKAIGDLDEKARQTGSGDPFVPYSEGAQQAADGAERAASFLKALKTIIEEEGDATTKSALAKKLLADAMEETGASVSSASGKIKLTAAALEDLDVSADDAETAMGELQQTLAQFGSPLDAFKNAAESAFKGATDAVDKFSLQSKGGLEAYIKELEKIAKAQRDWSANLVEISATLGPDIAEQFRRLGPEAAPAVAELADLSAEELAKLGPRLREIGDNATSELAAGILANSGQIKSASLQTRTVVANVFGNMVDKAKTSADFAEVSNQYTRLVQELNKSKVKIEISADDAKAFRSLNDIRIYIDLINNYKIKPEVALDIVAARRSIATLQEAIKQAEASGSLDPKGRARLEALLFRTQLNKLTTDIDALEAEGKLDAKGRGVLTDAEYRAKVLALTQFLASTEGQGLLNPKGSARLNDKAYRAQMQALATLILGKEAAGEFDVNGDGKLSTAEFKALLDALKRAVTDANRGKLDPKGRVTLANVDGFKGQLGGIVQAAYRAGGSITQALTRSATVSVGYYYYQKNTPPRVAQAASGGWINGPGGPKSDVIPAMLSNGEFVVNAAAAKRFGALLEVINRSGGRGFSGVAKRLFDAGITGGNKQVRLSRADSGTTMLGGGGMVQKVPPESVSVFSARLAMPSSGPTNVFNINNQYPQAEPTSVTVNRSLAYAATISGV